MEISKQRCWFYLFVLLIICSLFACTGGGGGGDGEKVHQNNPPDAINDHVGLQIGESVSIPVIDNDSDTDGSIDANTLTIIQAPQHGIAVISGEKIVYTPNNSYAGTDEIIYQISDDDGATANATILITVNQKNISLTAESGVGAAFYKDDIAFYSRGGGGGGGRGFNIAVLDSITGELIEASRNYDTWGGGSVEGAALADYINHEIPVGAIVMIAVGDSAGNYGSELVSALEKLGATQADNIGWRHTWAMIAIKGEGVFDEVRENGQWQNISATVNIKLDLEDPHGDTLENATQLELDNAVLGYLYEGETDMFWLDISHDGVLTLSNSKPDETLTIVRDSLGEVITLSSDYHQFADNSIKYYLNSGVYYVEVRSSNSHTVGSFVLKSQYIIDPPLPEDLTFTAQSSVGAEFAVNEELFFARGGGSGGGRGFNIAVVDPLTGYIQVTGKNFDTWEQGEAAGNALSTYIDGIGNGSMLLLAVGDSAGNYGDTLMNTLRILGATQADNIGWRHTWAMIVIKGDDVLDEVRANEHWTTKVAEAILTVPGHDMAGQTFTEVIALEIDSFTPSYLHENDVDVYYFKIVDPGIIWLESRGDIDTKARLYALNASGDIVVYSTGDHGGTAYNFLLQENLSAGTYYIEISGHGMAPIGQYGLLVTTK